METYRKRRWRNFASSHENIGGYSKWISSALAGVDQQRRWVKTGVESGNGEEVNDDNEDDSK